MSSVSVPLLDVNAQNLPLEAELTAAFSRVLKSGMFIMGAELEAFEKEMAAMLGVKHALGVSSGTDAILLALMALDLGPGDEVIVPAFTFFATAGCVSRVGATPVFADVCPVCFNLDVESVRALITPKTKAIIPVHLFGQSADLDSLLALAKEHGLKVIEDTAQSLGAKYKGTFCGTVGEFGTYSFFPSKNLGGFGDSGLLVTNDDTLADYARVLRVHGMAPKYYHRYIGANFRMDPLQAALLRVKLPHYAHYCDRRRANAAYYTEKLSALRGIVEADPAHCCCLTAQDQAQQQATLILPVAYAHNHHIWNQYTLRVPGEGRRDALKAHLAAHGVASEIYYPVSLPDQECYAGNTANTPVSRRLSSEVLSLPVYPELTEAQLAKVCEAVGSFL